MYTMITLFLLAFVLSFFSNLLIVFFASKHNYFIDHSHTDKPQNFHTDSTPRAGGLGIFMGAILLLLSSLGFKLILSILFAFASGIFEDFHNSLSARFRLLLQVIAAAVAIGLIHAVVTYLGLGITLPYTVGVLFSIFAIVGMMNAINIIDGFNGLASGVVLLILSSFAIVAYTHNNTDVLMIISIVSGATSGFFVLNFPKGKVFLGDGGAYMLGFIVAVLGIFLAGKYEDVSPWYILAIFIYPVWEVLFSIVRKLSMGRSPLSPDGDHMHMLVYRQVTRNNPMTALVINLYFLIFIAISTYYSGSSIANIAVISVFILTYLALYRYLYHKNHRKII